MDLFSFITLFGGLAFFLYGMHVMSSGLEKLAGSRLEESLKKMTANPFSGLLLGAGITIIIQSSSAMTVMLVGLVNSGIMQLGQTISVIMGSNIGTTLTAWLLSLISIESDNFFMLLVKPENFSLIFAFVGAMLIMMAKTQRRRDIGGIFVGFAVLMYGMKLMSDAVSPLADMPEFASMLVAFRNPIVGVLVGAVFTGIIQSSAASVGILQALALTGNISYGMAIPIIMGQNIGTCATALISSIGVNRNAKRVAVVHVGIKTIGTVVVLIIYYIVDAIDTVTGKIEMIVRADLANTPIISSMGAGNKLNPAAFEVTDIYKTSVCPLARVMRRELKARGIRKLKVVYSKEPAMTPIESEENSCSGHCVCPPGTARTCTKRRQIPGSMAFVPSVAGLIIAGEIVKDLTGIRNE